MWKRKGARYTQSKVIGVRLVQQLLHSTDLPMSHENDSRYSVSSSGASKSFRGSSYVAFTAIAANPTAISIITYLLHSAWATVPLEAYCTQHSIGYNPNVPPSLAASYSGVAHDLHFVLLQSILRKLQVFGVCLLTPYAAGCCRGRFFNWIYIRIGMGQHEMHAYITRMTSDDINDTT